MDNSLLRVENLTVAFDGFTVLDRLSIALQPRATRVIIGPNGAGKSTLLDAIIGRVAPVSGRILFRGHNLTGMPEHEIALLGICRKFQTPGVLDNLTLYDNLCLAARRAKQWWQTLGCRLDPAERETVRATLDLIGLDDKRDRPARELAHGEKQWLEIGMVVASGAELLLLDEPAAGLDLGARERLVTLLGRFALDGVVPPIVLVTHHLEEVPSGFTHGALLSAGRLLSAGPLDSVFTSHAISDCFGVRVDVSGATGRRWHARAAY